MICPNCHYPIPVECSACGITHQPPGGSYCRIHAPNAAALYGDAAVAQAQADRAQARNRPYENLFAWEQNHANR